MDRDDILDLLALIAAADHRTVGKSDVVIWSQILSHLDKDDCLTAILAFRAEEPGNWLEPGHVLKRVRAMMRDRLDREDPDARAAIAAPAGAKIDRDGYIDKSADPEPYEPFEPVRGFGPASAEVRAQAIAEFARSRQKDTDDASSSGIAADVKPLMIRCKHCKAPAGERCTAPGMPGKPREVLTRMPAHPTRIREAALAAGYGAKDAEDMVDAALAGGVKRARASWVDALPKTPDGLIGAEERQKLHDDLSRMGAARRKAEAESGPIPMA